MKKLKNNLDQLIQRNKEAILNDPKEMNRIEQKIDMKHTSTKKENA